VKRNDFLLLAMLAVGTATFVYAVVKRLKGIKVTPYARPKGGEKIGDFEAFIGS